MKNIIMAVFVFAAGCAPAMAQHDRAARGAAGGALIGAATGAAAGAIAGNPGKGAAIGAIVGTVAGTLFGSAQQGRPGYGYGGGGYENPEDICNRYSSPIDRQACLEGVSEGEVTRARRIRSDCERIGRDGGYYGHGYPDEVANRYEKESYRNACEEGLRVGYPKGQERRASYIKSRARRATSGGW